MVAQRINQTAVQAELVKQWEHWLAYARLAAMRNAASYGQIMKLGKNVGSVDLNDSEGQKHSIPLADFKAALRRIENVALLPYRIFGPALKPQDIANFPNWVSSDCRMADKVAPTLWEWTQHGAETFFVEPEFGDGKQTGSLVGRKLKLPQKNIMLRSSETIHLDEMSGQGELILDTFSVRWNSNRNHIVIIPIPRTSNRVGDVLTENQMVKLWRQCTNMTNPRVVEEKIDKAMSALARAYVQWFPGLTIHLSAETEGDFLVLTGEASLEPAGITAKSESEHVQEIATNCIATVVNALEKLAEVDDAVKAARTSRASKLSAGGKGAESEPHLFQEPALFHIGSTRWLRETGHEVEDIERPESGEKRRSPYPHPRYCSYRRLPDGTIEPISVKGWNPAIHGFPQGRYTVVYS